MTYRTGLAVVLAVALVASACSTGVSDAPENDESTTVSTTVPAAVDETSTPAPSEGDDPTVNEPLPTTPPLSTNRSYEGDGYPAELTGLVGIAVADLAKRLGVEESAIAVVSVEEVVWPNRAIGCEQPGMKHAQVPTDGMLIILAHAGVEYAYHSGGTLDPFLCIPNQVKESVPPKIDITEGTITTVPGTGTGETVPTETPGGPGDPDV